MTVRHFHTLGTLGIGVLFLAALPVAAAPTYTQNVFSSDAQFNVAYGGQGTDYESFGYEGRIGGTTTYEYNLNGRNANNAFQFGLVSGEYVWQNNVNVPFTLTYSGDTTRQVTWTIASQPTLTITANAGNINRFLVRTRAGGGNTTEVRFSSLTDTATNQVFTAPGTALALSQGAGTVVDYLSVTGFDFTRAFSMQGTARMAWTGTKPTGSGNAFEIKGMQASIVPEPATMTFFGFALSVPLATVSRRRRRVRSVA